MSEGWVLLLLGWLTYASMLLLVSFGVTAWGLSRQPHLKQTFRLAWTSSLQHATLALFFGWRTFEIIIRVPEPSFDVTAGFGILVGIILTAKSLLIWAMTKTYDQGRQRWPFAVYWIGLIVIAVLVALRESAIHP